MSCKGHKVKNVKQSEITWQITIVHTSYFEEVCNATELAALRISGHQILTRYGAFSWTALMGTFSGEGTIAVNDALIGVSAL